MLVINTITVMNCDIIFYMEDGKIIDQGTYPELLQRNKKFREMAKEKKREDK
jgi:ABC-type multidrug transport system fused ATPase/permease subunit